jgi:DNA-binding transcriptional regulator YiaG
MSKRKTTTDAVEILHRRYVENNPAVRHALNEERANHRIAKTIMDLRGQLGLSQRKFAELVGTTAAVIRQLEDADYEGNAMGMLEHIAAAVSQETELDIRFVPAKKHRIVSRNGAARKKKEQVGA